MKKYIFLAFLLIIGAGGYYLFNNLESIVIKLVNKYGSQVTGTNVALKGFKLDLTTGEARAKKFTVANPRGYNSPNLFSADEIYVRVNIKSLTSNTIIVEEIRVEKPAMSYEMKNLTENNVTDIMNNVQKNTKSANEAEKADASSKSEAGSGKKVVINKVAINSTALAAALQTPSIPGVLESQAISQSVTLPNIVIKDIGKGKDGESITGAISTIMNRILSEATKSVTDVLGSVKDEALKTLNDAKDLAKGTVNDAKDLAKGTVNDAAGLAKGTVNDVTSTVKDTLGGFGF